jgi:hypothetical protein
VDELVGHNSQGFLPVFAPHFGGLWQPVSLEIVPEIHVDTDRLMAVGDIASGHIQFEIPVLGKSMAKVLPDRVAIRVRERNAQPSQGVPSQVVAESFYPLDSAMKKLLSSGQPLLISHSVLVPKHRLWSPDSPALYDVEIAMERSQVQKIVLMDRVACRSAFREIKVDGDRLLLNGQPLQIRGVLNWGYAPPSTAPSIDPSDWKAEIDQIRAYGFNTMKFCLWVPPRGYLDMADEMGLLSWVEYPTWHSRWSQDQLPTLRNEFTEFFHLDRNHPSIVLRSLTCETGPSADLQVIRSLYDLCHQMIPGSIVEDDSSWIQWNRVHDFYDDHPYGNNHTWVNTLDRLKKHIESNGTKPLVLGEAIAADTWASPASLLRDMGENRPFWLPNFIDANGQWLSARTQDMGAETMQSLDRDSLAYAMSMRKFQIEAYRREVPHGGYVVSVLRDFPFAGMGLLDFQGRAKWDTEQWNWHRSSCILLKTDHDRRSFRRSELFQGELSLSHFGERPTDGDLKGKLTVRLTSTETNVPVVLISESLQTIGPSGVMQLAGLSAKWDELVPLRSSEPVPLQLIAQLEIADSEPVQNQWTLWVLPEVARNEFRIAVHPSMDFSNARTLFPEATMLQSQTSNVDTVILTRRLDEDLLNRLSSGASVFMLPDGEKGSFPTKEHWFLRGGPVVEKSSWTAHWREMLLELQHFDLAAAVVSDLQWLDQMQPSAMLWDNHDIDHVKTHGLVFSTKIGRGTLLVSSLEHMGETNAAGEWLARSFANQLHRNQVPVKSMQPETIEAMRAKLSQQTINLTDRKWSFRIDKENRGLADHWQSISLSDPDLWSPIAIGKHWEGLGYPALDGWAWYRTEVQLPESWNGAPLFVFIDGADDFYELYINGKLVGSAGDIANKKTAFEEQRCFEATSFLERGKPVVIAIRVYDWYGSGGLFRPIQLSTTPRSPMSQILR